MKRFVCTVCGYVHVGLEPPERCPRCHAPRERFVELEADGGRDARARSAAPSARSADASTRERIRRAARDQAEAAAIWLSAAWLAVGESSPEAAVEYAKLSVSSLDRAAELYRLLGDASLPDSRATALLRAEADRAAAEGLASLLEGFRGDEAAKAELSRIVETAGRDVEAARELVDRT
jgi:hypothetical protein